PRFYDGPKAVRAGRGDGNADATFDTAGKAGVVCELPPRISSVRRLEQAAARSPAGQGPCSSMCFPHRGIENPRIRGIHTEITGSHQIVSKEDALPCPAAVCRPKYTAFRVGAVHMAKRCHISEVGVSRVNANPCDVSGVGQPNVVPGFAAIVRSVD